MKDSERQKEILPRYMTTKKKYYYLASSKENVHQLVKEEIVGLTKVLIELKSQYDIIRRENITKKNEINEICKKIDSLQTMDLSCKQKIDKTSNLSNDLKEQIKEKKLNLNEVTYEMKTLLNTKSKLKKDLFIIQKQILGEEEHSRKLNKNMLKEKFLETQIKEKKNKVYSQISEQQKKNEFNKNEQTLQEQYYRTIIKQRYMFLKSDDERKERQKKIALEAKNDSADKQEVDRRKTLELLKLYHNFIEYQLDKAIKKNKEIEEIYLKVRDITGSSSLKIITDKIIFKDKRYNEAISNVAEIQNQIEILNKDIEEKELKLKELKNSIVFNEIDDKNIQTVNTNIIEEHENSLINQEQELTKLVENLEQKAQELNLTFKNIVQNILIFEEEEELMRKNKNIFMDINENNNKNYTKNNSPEETIEMQQTTLPGISNTDNNSMQFTQSAINTHTQLFDNINNININNNINNTFEIKEGSEGIDECANININNDNYKEDEYKFQRQNLFLSENQEDIIIKKFEEFINNLMKKFDKFFLCYNKKQFLAFMTEKGFKNNEDNKVKFNDFDNKRKISDNKNPKRGSRISNSNNIYNVDNLRKNLKNNDDEIIEDLNDDEQIFEEDDNNKKKRKKGPSKDIFLRFLEQQEAIVNDFIYNKTEGNLRKKKN